MATDVTTPGTGPAEHTKPEGSASIWVRGLYMLLFLIITRLTELLIALVMLIQFIVKAAGGSTNVNLLTFGDQLSRYLYSIIQFQTFNTEEKPFPFKQWPQAEEKSPQ